MNFGIIEGQNNLVVSFTRAEMKWCLPLIQLSLEEEEGRGGRIPSPDELPLRRSSELPNDYYLDFSFEYMSLGMVFLRNIYERCEWSTDTRRMEEVLMVLDGLCGNDKVLH